MNHKDTDTLSGCILVNARVVTMDPRQPTAELVAIKGNTILGVGNKRDVSRFKGHGMRIVDCGGATIIPGFNDAHCHPLSFATALLYVDCSPNTVKNISDVQDRIRQRSKETPRGKWIFGIGIGFLAMVMRLFSSYPEGIMFAVLLMNAVTPLINRWTIPRPFGGA